MMIRLTFCSVNSSLPFNYYTNCSECFFFSILCFYLVQVFFVICKPKQNYKQIELETADIMTATLITLLPFPTELLHSNKVRFAPQLS